MSTPSVPPASTATRRRLDPAERRAQVVATACAIARSDGLAQVTTRAVAARAGITSALVSHYAPSMDELVADVFGRVVTAELDDVRALLDPVPPGRALEVLVRTLLDGDRDDVTLVWVESWALGRRNEALAARVRDRMDAWKVLVREVIDAGVAAGDLEVDDADAAAWQVLGMVDGLNAQSLVRWGGTTDRADLVLRAVEGMLGRRGPGGTPPGPRRP